MGYDMYTVEQPSRIAEIERLLWGPGSKPLTQAEKSALYAERRALQDDRLSYFRLNVWGMGAYCRHMETIGMLEWGGDHPPFPDSADFNIPQQTVIYNGKAYQEDDEESSEYRRYDAATRKVLAWTDTEVIAGHKFGSNDGWIVTPREIAAALDAYRRYVAEHEVGELVKDDLDYWKRWISFLATAAEAGGFEVR
jgi:hypothetical protein